MFELGKTIVSEAILEKDFVCNLSACKGACCVAGDAGAPLEEGELQTLKDIYPAVKPLLRPEGVQAIEKQGHYTTNALGEHETPLIDNADCAYVIYDEKKTALCGIEEAYNSGLISWKKPVSCHLYPIRVRDYSEFSGVNYDQWEICDPACALGEELQVPVYKFLKQALVRNLEKTGMLNWRKLERPIKTNDAIFRFYLSGVFLRFENQNSRFLPIEICFFYHIYFFVFF